MAEKAVKPEAEEVVDGFRTVNLFKDNNKYAGDVFVGLNGRAYRIQRGKHVRVPKAVAEILERSLEQDARTAELIDRESKKED